MLLFLLPHLSKSWWAHAHMVITEIAAKSLSSAKKKQLQYLVNQNSLPTQTFIQSAGWQDELKDVYHLNAMGNWHFADGPLIRNETKPVKIAQPSYNVTSFLIDSWAALNDPSTTSIWAWAFHLRSLIHFVGDVHTPHHNVALYSDEFITGDRGGNSYKINCPYGAACNNIHFIWDAVGLDYVMADPTLPKTHEAFEKNVSKVVSTYPKENLNLDFAPANWSNEAYQMAALYGYETEMLSFPSKQYFDIVRKYGNEMVARAGYRLGAVLDKILDKAPVQEEKHIDEILLWSINIVLFVFCIVSLTCIRRKSNKFEFESLTQNTSYI